MAAGRRKESRLHACIQAALVWSIDEIDVDRFVNAGEIAGPKHTPMDPQLRAHVDKYIDQYMTTGKIVVDAQ